MVLLMAPAILWRSRLAIECSWIEKCHARPINAPFRPGSGRLAHPRPDRDGGCFSRGNHAVLRIDSCPSGRCAVNIHGIDDRFCYSRRADDMRSEVLASAEGDDDMDGVGTRTVHCHCMAGHRRNSCRHLRNIQELTAHLLQRFAEASSRSWITNHDPTATMRRSSGRGGEVLQQS